MNDDDRQLQRLIQGSARRSFGPGFSNRVLRRLQAEGSAFETLLLREFRWLAAAASLAAVALGLYSTLGYTDDRSLLEAALGLEPVSIDSAYSLDTALFELDEAEETRS